MTFDYRAWRKRLKLTHLEAALLLGISLRHSHYLSAGKYQPRQTTVLACGAIEAQKEGDRAD